MSRRTNGTNRAGVPAGIQQCTGYGKPKKKTASLAELNGHVNEKYNYTLIITGQEGKNNGSSYN